jgi:hypothetical protein
MQMTDDLFFFLLMVVMWMTDDFCGMTDDFYADDR